MSAKKCVQLLHMGVTYEHDDFTPVIPEPEPEPEPVPVPAPVPVPEPEPEPVPVTPEDEEEDVPVQRSAALIEEALNATLSSQ